MTHSFLERTRALRAAYPRLVAAITVLLALLLVVDAVMAARVWQLRRESARLRARMSEAVRTRTDLAITSAENRAITIAELVRRQAAADRDLNLAIDIDSARMLLQRDGVTLREMPVAIGRDRAGSAADSSDAGLSRGARTIEAVLGASAEWEVPERVFHDRALPVPERRSAKGVLGRVAFLLDGGSVIYALPKEGPLADSSYVLAGAVLLRSDDLRAIAPNVTTGMTVYVYE